jgi:uncharacterized protein YbcI
METHPQDRRPEVVIATEAGKLLRDYTGPGPTKAKATINGDSVMILLADSLSKAERRLVESGKAERVLQLRHDVQEVMRDDLVQLVERATGRKVIAFMIDNHLDPDLAAETFVLAPAAVTD